MLTIGRVSGLVGFTILSFSLSKIDWLDKTIENALIQLVSPTDLNIRMYG